MTLGGLIHDALGLAGEPLPGCALPGAEEKPAFVAAFRGRVDDVDAILRAELHSLLQFAP